MVSFHSFSKTIKAELNTSLAGVNIAGFDFGMSTDGAQDIKTAYPPLTALGGADGAVCLFSWIFFMFHDLKNLLSFCED